MIYWLAAAHACRSMYCIRISAIIVETFGRALCATRPVRAVVLVQNITIHFHEINSHRINGKTPTALNHFRSILRRVAYFSLFNPIAQSIP